MSRPLLPATAAARPLPSPPAAFPRRRALLALAPLLAPTLPALAAPPGFKKDLTKGRRKPRLPDEAYEKVGDKGLLIHDEKVGTGRLVAVGDRVVVHYEARWRGVTFMTSRQGLGVTGGTPLGFDVGAVGAGGTLPGLDLGVRGMRVGGQRLLRVPPALAYGDKGVGEVPPGATLDL